MAGDIDIVIQSEGGDEFKPFKPIEKLDLSAYERVKTNRKLTRKLLSIHCGAGEDLEANRKELLAEIDKATGNDDRRIGALCLFGSSNGCGLILALARTLVRDRFNAPDILYIGLADVTMFPFGRKPEVPDVGNLQPVDPPQVSFGLSGGVRGLTSRVGQAPSASDLPPPEIADPGVPARIRKNFFTVQGNRVKVVSQSPAGRDTWWWTSDMQFGEVHGAIPGWDNIPRFTTADSDFRHHVQLCNEIAIPAMKGDVAVEMSKFVADPNNLR